MDDDVNFVIAVVFVFVIGIVVVIDGVVTAVAVMQRQFMTVVTPPAPQAAETREGVWSECHWEHFSFFLFLFYLLDFELVGIGEKGRESIFYSFFTFSGDMRVEKESCGGMFIERKRACHRAVVSGMQNSHAGRLKTHLAGKGRRKGSVTNPPIASVTSMSRDTPGIRRGGGRGEGGRRGR